ncbi:MAG TPA: hypothetical protein VGB96_12840, partial [Archangium sp.]
MEKKLVVEKKVKTRKTNTVVNKTLVNKQPMFEKELGPLMQAIDNAVADIRDERKRQEARQLVGEAIHGAMRQLVASPSAPPAALAPKAAASPTTITTAVDAAKSVQNLGFVEFTTGLINGTFDAIISATIKQ